jgi:hypothetical protein
MDKPEWERGGESANLTVFKEWSGGEHMETFTGSRMSFGSSPSAQA